MQKPKLSIVTSLYKSESYVEEFYFRVCRSANKLFNSDFEIIFVDDGSPDSSSEKVSLLAKKDARVRLVKLSRNFGHHNAIHAGLEASIGELVFLIDVDLEEQPEWLIDFFEKLSKQSLDVVYGKQLVRKGGMFERLTGSLWYKIINIFSDLKHDQNITTARLMTREYVTAFFQLQEKTSLISVLFLITGFNQEAIFVKKLSISPSTYSLKTKIAFAVSFLINQTNRPLFLVLMLNLIFAQIAFVAVVILFIHKLMNENTLDGWTSLAMISVVSYILQTVSISMIGLYVAQINSEIKNRPRYIIKSDEKPKSWSDTHVN